MMIGVSETIKKSSRCGGRNFTFWFLLWLSLPIPIFATVMAKKKVSDSKKEQKKQGQDAVRSHDELPPAVDTDFSDKFEKLRDLNQRLVREELKRRQEIEVLLEANGSLEEELILAKSASEGVKIELDEEIAGLDVEETVFSVFVTAQIGEQWGAIERRVKMLESEAQELKNLHDEKDNKIGELSERIDEIVDSVTKEKNFSSDVSAERDAIRVTLVSKNEEVDSLKENLSLLEVRNKELLADMERLRLDHVSAARSSKEGEIRVGSLTRERDSLKESLMEAANLIKELKEEISNAIAEKRRIQEMEGAEMCRIKKLENVVCELNEKVAKLLKNEEALLANVNQMKKRCTESEAQIKEMEGEINQLTEGKKLAEERAEELSESKIVELGKAMEQLAGEKDKGDKLVLEKMILLEVNFAVGIEVNQLQKRESELNAIVSELWESRDADAERIKGLEYEIEDYRCKFEGLELDRNEMLICLEGEKQNVMELKKRIDELVDEIEQRIRDAGEAEDVKEAILAEKEELKMQYETLKMKLISLENMVNVAQTENESMKGRAELVDARNEMILNMLKKTSAFCQKEGETDGFDDYFQISGEEIKPFVAEIQTITDAFRNKETKAETMEQQVKSLERCVDQAEKKKSLWAVLTSATSIVAAFSLAYAARKLNF